MDYKESKILFTSLFNHEMNDKEMREFLLSIKLDKNTDTQSIQAAAEVMRSFSTKLPISKSLREKALDIVGTGGDKIGSFNISSTVSLLACASGSLVAKHGSRSITSKSGSADLFETIGLKLDLSLENSAKLLEESGFTFMFAQNHHPAMKFIMPVRKSISDKTIFNILGPLTNPAHIEKSMLGVFDKEFIPKIANALQKNGAKSFMVLSSKEGMDEISISDVSYISELKNSKIKEYEFDSEVYGIKKAPLSSIIGGNSKQNAKILYDIFNQNATDAQRDIVLINTACALVVDDKARDIQDGLEIANATIKSKKAINKLKQIIDISNKL